MRRAAERIVRHCSHSCLLSVWKSWCDNHWHLRAAKHCAEKGILHWSQSSLARIWSAWQHQHTEAVRLRLIGSKILLNWALQELSRPWHAWRHQTSEKKRLKRSANKALQRWTNARLYPAFHSWEGEYRAVKRRAAIADKVVKRWLSMTCSSAFNRWMEQANQQGALRELTNNVLSRWTHKGLTGSWNMWCAVVSESQRLSRAFEKTACRWMKLGTSKSWDTWTDYLKSQRAAAALEEEIRKTFARIERAFATSFAKCVMEQWHAVTSSKLAAQFRLQGVSFLAWRGRAAESARFVRSSNTIRANGITRRKGGAYTAILWECTQFKASYRTRVLIAFQRLRQRRLAAWCVLHWIYTVKAACEEEAHLREESQICKAKSLAHFLSEWRIVAVRQRDLRESASTIAQQWEREITLKKKLNQPTPPEPASPSKNRPSSGTTVQSPTTSSQAHGVMVKTMWADMPVLSPGQQHPAGIGPLTWGENDPQVYRHGLAEPYSSFAHVRRAPSAASTLPMDHNTLPMDHKEAFRRWHAALALKLPQKPSLTLADLTAPLNEPTAYDTALASPRTLKLKSLRGQTDAGSPRTLKLKSPRGQTDAGAKSPSLVPRPPQSPVPRLPLDKLTLEVDDDDLFNMPAPQVPGKSSSSSSVPKQSPKRPSPKKLLKSPRQEAAAKTAAFAPVPTKQTPAGFFPDNVLSLPAWMLGGQSTKAAATASSQGENWLNIGFATPHSTAEAAGASSTEPQVSAPNPQPVPAAPLPSVASAPPKLKMKRELVPSPRNLELTAEQRALAESDIKEAAAAAGVAKNKEEEEAAKQKTVEEAAYVGVGMRIQDDPPHKIVSIVPGELCATTHARARRETGDRQTDTTHANTALYTMYMYTSQGQ